MAKYLVSYRVEGVETRTIYTTKGDMTEEDVNNFEYEMSKKKYGRVIMTGFTKLAESTKEEKPTETPTSNLAAFFLYDFDYAEAVLVYTPIDNLVSYNFERGKQVITLLDDNLKEYNKYICPIPGIWFGGEDVMSKIPVNLKSQFPHTYLYSSEYKKYETVK